MRLEIKNPLKEFNLEAGTYYVIADSANKLIAMFCSRTIADDFLYSSQEDYELFEVTYTPEVQIAKQEF